MDGNLLSLTDFLGTKYNGFVVPYMASQFNKILSLPRAYVLQQQKPNSTSQRKNNCCKRTAGVHSPLLHWGLGMT